jgi:acyl carrier protein
MSSEIDILTEYIRAESGHAGAISPEQDLLQAGILDSFSIVALAMFAQERFDVQFDGDEIVRDNLASLAALVALIRRKQSAARSE